MIQVQQSPEIRSATKNQKAFSGGGEYFSDMYKNDTRSYDKTIRKKEYWNAVKKLMSGEYSISVSSLLQVLNE